MKFRPTAQFIILEVHGRRKAESQPNMLINLLPRVNDIMFFAHIQITLRKPKYADLRSGSYHCINLAYS